MKKVIELIESQLRDKLLMTALRFRHNGPRTSAQLRHGLTIVRSIELSDVWAHRCLQAQKFTTD